MVSFPSSVIAGKAPESNFRYTVIENLLNMCTFFINIIVSPMTCILYSIVTIVYCIYIYFFLLATARLANIATNGLVTILLPNVSTINYYHYRIIITAAIKKTQHTATNS